MDQLFTPATLLVSTIFGMMASYFAYSRKWNPYLWFFIGFVFGIIGLFALFLAPKKRRSRRRKQVAQPALQGPSDKLWFYLDPTHQQVGPISYNAITKALHQGQISKTTYVWHENLSEWKKLNELYKNS